MANLVPSEGENFMQAYIGPEGYVRMTWPKKLSLAGLQDMRDSVNLQIDQFIKSARRETEREEAARLEYESWFPGATPPPIEQAIGRANRGAK